MDAGSGQFVIDPKSSTLLGRRVIQTTKASAGSVYLGVWEQLLVALFGGLEIAKVAIRMFDPCQFMAQP